MKNSNTKKIVSIVLAVALSLSMILSAVAGFMSLKSSDDDSSESTAAVTQADYDYSANFDENGYFKDVTAGDYVTLPDYKSYEIPAELTVADEEEVQSQIDSIRASYTTSSYDTTAGTVVEEGDTVNIDYVGSVDGVEFTNGSTEGNGTDLTLGSGTYIPARGDCEGFEEQVEGHAVGETFDITVQFPDGYSSSTDADGNTIELSNAVAVFTVTINSIEVTTVPEINDEFVAENLSDMYDSYDDMVESIKSSLIKNQELDYVWDKLKEESAVNDYPEEIVAFEKDLEQQTVDTYASYYGYTTEDFLAAMGYESFDEYWAAVEDSVYEDIDGILIVQAVCEKEGIRATDESVAAFFEEYYGTTDYSSYTTYYGENYVKFASLTDTMLSDIMADMKVAE